MPPSHNIRAICLRYNLITMVHFMKRKFLNQRVDLSVVDLAQLQTTIFPLTSKDWLIIQTEDDI